MKNYHFYYPNSKKEYLPLKFRNEYITIVIKPQDNSINVFDIVLNLGNAILKKQVTPFTVDNTKFCLNEKVLAMGSFWAKELQRNKIHSSFYSESVFLPKLGMGFYQNLSSHILKFSYDSNKKGTDIEATLNTNTFDIYSFDAYENVIINEYLLKIKTLLIILNQNTVKNIHCTFTEEE